MEFCRHPFLSVNTASECGCIPPYVDLQRLWERYRAQGLIVLGVPSEDHLRADLVGSLSPGARAFGLRRARSRSQVKTRRQHLTTAAAVQQAWLASD
ncbi:MAG: hypothetical protein U1F76_30170 [Candidatus Competibacteraceae bacterium]